MPDILTCIFTEFEFYNEDGTILQADDMFFINKNEGAFGRVYINTN